MLNFDIRNYLSQLTGVKGQRGKYYCPNPNCNSNNLSINHRTGAYDCYSCHDLPAIREAIAPIAEKWREIQPQKALRPKQTREWIYYDLKGKPLIKVRRVDDGNGNRKFSQFHWNGKHWLSGYGNVKREDIPIYQYQAILEAIAAGKTIFIVEGESCCDILWKLGIAATCNIGGAGKWLPHHSAQLKGASVVICPDRDQSGIKHIEKIAQDFPTAQYLYAYPDSYIWQKLPPNHGLDLADWINDYHLKAEDIFSSVESQKRELINPAHPSDKVIEITSHSNFQFSPELIQQSLLIILNKNLSDSQLQLEINDLINHSGWSSKEIWKIYHSLNKEQELGENINQDVAQFKKLIDFDNEVLRLDYLLPEPLANSLNSKASSDQLDPVRMLQNLLPAIGTILGSKIGIVAKEGFCDADSWIEYPVVWTADISPPSTGKSNAHRAIWQPIKALQQKEVERYNQAMKEYEEVKAQWQDFTKEEKAEYRNTEDNPKVFKKRHCYQRKWLFDVGQIEAILRRLSEQSSDCGTSWVADELSGLFRGLDQYKAGNRGDSLQILLETWNGKINKTIDRVELSNSYSLTGQTLNICGGIQPQKAQEIWRTQDDPDGFLSRMLPALSKIPEDFAVWSEQKVNIYGELTAFYEELAQLSATLIRIAPSAQQEWQLYWEALRRGYLQYEKTNPAYAYFLGKQCSYTVRLALILHTVDYVYGLAQSLETCSLSAMQRAIYLSKYYCHQFRLLQSEGKDQNSLDGLLLKVYKLLHSAGEVSTRTIAQRFKRDTYQGEKINASVALEVLKTLSAHGFGNLEGKKLIKLSNSNLENVGNVGNVGTNVGTVKASQDEENRHLLTMLADQAQKKVNEVNTISAPSTSNSRQELALSDQEKLLEADDFWLDQTTPPNYANMANKTAKPLSNQLFNDVGNLPTTANIANNQELRATKINSVDSQTTLINREDKIVKPLHSEDANMIQPQITELKAKTVNKMLKPLQDEDANMVDKMTTGNNNLADLEANHNVNSEPKTLKPLQGENANMVDKMTTEPLNREQIENLPPDHHVNLVEKTLKPLSSENANIVDKVTTKTNYESIAEIEETKLLSIGDQVKILETEDKGKIGIIISIKNELGHTQDTEGNLITSVSADSFNFSFKVKFEDDYCESFYGLQLRKE